MFCTNCGGQLADEATFCNWCGVAVGAPTAEIAMPAPTAEIAMPAPTAEIAMPAPTAPAARATWPIVAGVIGAAVVVVLGVVGALFATGVIGDGLRPRAAAETTPPGGEAPAVQSAPEQSDTPAANEVTTLDAEASYVLLEEHYAQLWDLHESIGLAYTDRYGGTGFAYDYFNPRIGSPDRAVRVELADACRDLSDSIRDSRLTLEGASIAPEYVEQQGDLLRLYDLLEGRIDAMKGAAEIAVDRPDEPSWRPVLSPASTDMRVAFEDEYPSARPYRR